MRSRELGAILLIVGTCLGGGILALPLISAGLNVFVIVATLLAVWFVMTLSALYIAEINLRLPHDPNLVSIARETLGPVGVGIAWLSSLLLLYTLICLYLAGGTDLISGLLLRAGWLIPDWCATLLFLGVFLMIICHGMRSIDWANRGFMFIKLIALSLLLVFLIPRGSLSQLVWSQSASDPMSAILPMALSFGFATVVPSISAYLDKQEKLVRFATFMGSLCPIVIYLAWILVVQSNISAPALQIIAASHQAMTELSLALHERSIGIGGASFISELFFAISITTSFLGVSLSLLDFIIDAFRFKKNAVTERFSLKVLMLAFMPPLLIVLLKPDIFLITLKVAGALCILLLALLPTLMMWSASYRKNIVQSVPFYGTKAILMLNLLAASFLLYLALKESL